MIDLLLALACGSERLSVKTLRDAPELATQKAAVTSVAALGDLPPIQWHNKAPRTADERQVAGVVAWVVGYKLETDSDWHVVIRDAAGRTMIIEFPHPGCASSPAVADVFKRARAQFAAVAGAGSPPPSPRFYQLPQPIPVAVAGVVFLDHPHGQIGRAPKNDVELHPVTWISRRAR